MTHQVDLSFITLWGVLEHVADPLATMRLVCEHLNARGVTWVMTPNTNALERFLKGPNYFNFLNKSHLTHFHRTTLKALLEKAKAFYAAFDFLDAYRLASAAGS